MVPKSIEMNVFYRVNSSPYWLDLALLFDGFIKNNSHFS
jgi:hypothetical protein